MFREMLRKNKEIKKDKIIAILKKGEYGVLSTICENG